MKTKLINQINENFGKYQEEILKHLEEYSYRKQRYGIDYTIALYISSKEIPKDIIKSYIRCTDRLIPLDANFVAVIFDFADEEKGLKASENLLSLIEPELFEEEIYLGVVSSHGDFDEKGSVRHALDLLIESIQSGCNDVPKLPTA